MRPVAPAVLLCLLLTALPPAPSVACTSFCLQTPDGPVFGTNLDLAFGDGHVFVNPHGIAKEGFRTGLQGETATWTSRYGSVTFSLIGREFAWGGMNEAGLVMTTMELMVSELPPPDERIPFDSGALVQYILDTSGTVPEAVERMRELRLVDDGNSPSHFLVADASGDCAAVEYLGGELVVHTGRDLPIPALANATYGASVAYAEHGTLPAFNPGASVERFAAAAARMESFRSESLLAAGSITAVDYCMDTLTGTVVAPRKWWTDLFDEPCTRWSIVFDIPRREAHFRTVDSPAVKRLALKSFDLSCSAPLLMMDVNSPRGGNVEAALAPWDAEENVEIFRSFCERWDLDVSREDAVGMTLFFGAFECAAPQS
ncbi:MAG: linear amide C-N hydrolase [Gemmatimonadetes bacterium]|nr:linear amide C-N hydrolase [Gemmatimonadota bacterium]